MTPKPLIDEFAVFAKAYKTLPESLYKDFLKAISELEDNECHRTHKFPHTQLHSIEGDIKDYSVYRAYINKLSGWRLHLQYGKKDHYLHVIDIIPGNNHDHVIKEIKNKKNRYQKKRK